MSAMQSALTWAEVIGHDGWALTAHYILERCGPPDIVAIEAPCQGHSTLGKQEGLYHQESGVLVPIAEALADLQFQLAQ